MFTVAGQNQFPNYNYWHEHQMLCSHAQGREESVPSALNPTGHEMLRHMRLTRAELKNLSEFYADRNLFVPVRLGNTWKTYLHVTRHRNSLAVQVYMTCRGSASEIYLFIYVSL